MSWTELLILYDDFIETEKEKYKERHDFTAYTAFYTVCMLGDWLNKKPIRLSDYIEKKSEPKEQTPEEMVTVLRLLNAINNGKEVEMDGESVLSD